MRLHESLSSLEVCRLISKNRKDGICHFSEPDDSIDLYIDFLERISYDWGNDDYLFELIDNVFHRKKGTESEQIS